jgi:hypothetical protein
MTTQAKPQTRILTILGAVAFFAAMILAIIGGFWVRDNGTIVLILVIMGIFVGFFNITSKELMLFLVAAIALVVSGTGGFEELNKLTTGFGDSINAIVRYIANFMAPAAIINAVKVVWQVARPG